MYLENLVIEVTRRCNMKCSHCLRGNAQGIDMDLSHINRLCRHFSNWEIGTVTFTGGELSLRPEIITHFRLQCAYNKIQLNNFYIATNGKKLSKEFIDECYMLYGQCTDNEISQVELSNDYRHREETIKNEFDKLECFNFAKPKHERNGEKYFLISEGRAKEYGERTKSADGFVVEEYNNRKEIREGQLYLNVKGELIDGCDWSYTSQQKYKICSVYDNITDILLTKYRKE